MRRRSGNEGGQATVEWIGLVLGVALALAAVAAGGREAVEGEAATGLGEAVAKRITCAARDACGVASAPGGGGRDGGAWGGGARGGRGGTWGGPRGGGLWGGPRGRGRRGSLRAPRGSRPSAPGRLPPSRAADGSRILPRAAAGLAKRAWIVCLGYQRWRYDVDHPRTPQQAVPVGDTLEIVNECVNPWWFFFG
jgi:hypothetical protein